KICLSKLALSCEDLPVSLMSRLASLERLDLSGNRLKEFPRALSLPALKHLDLSDNQMEDVTSLERLSGVEELCMEDNLYVTVSDNYKMMTLLPLLRMHNGKDVTATANHLRYVYTDNLRTRVSLGELQADQPLSKDKMAALEKDFVNTAKQQVKFGPSSVSDFTKWRVRLSSVLLSAVPASYTEEHQLVAITTTSTSCYWAASPTDTKQTPVKRALVPASTVRESPRKTGLKLTPQTSSPRKTSTRCTPQNLQTSSPRKTSTRCTPQNLQTSSPRKTSTRCTPQNLQTSSPRKTSTRCTPQNLQTSSPRKTSTRSRVCLKTHHALQCHSKQDSPDDLSTQLWACAFQPQSNAGPSRLVATCGGDSLCLIDCEVGVVMKKYKVPGEEFFALAWTTVLMCCGKATAAQPCSVLAAGGKRGVVKLIHPRNNIAYGEFRASRKALSVLRFNPNKGNFLYTGSYDNKIVLWDIGGLDNQYNYKVVQLMSLESSSTPCTSADRGLFQDVQYSHFERAILFKAVILIYSSKNHLLGRIYLWSWSQTLALSKKSAAVRAVVLAELQWADTQVPYLALSTCPGRSYVVCGDDKGQVWTYHIRDLKDKSNTPKILEWPAPLRNGSAPLDGPSINAVSTDPELRYLVALTDKNLVLVWKREETS
uniref:Leucine-rich repeat and WD repeat-containing protein 1 n=1 Tax=Neogobius melanostomus TaxID=47308 RepID=A0A8C6S876_9GOBI